MELWYEKPAALWSQALPLGNGRMGAMVFGGVNVERIQLNEDSIWTGSAGDRNNPDCRDHLSQIRSLILKEQIEEAEELASYAITGTPQSSAMYQPLGNLNILFFEKDSHAVFDTLLSSYIPRDPDPGIHYRRGLVLDQGLGYVNFEKEGTRYKREYFISCPDQVLVIHLRAEGTEKLRLACSLERREGVKRSWHPGSDRIAFAGKAAGDGVSFAGMLKALSPDGTIRTTGEHLIVEEASEVTLLFTAATSFRVEDPVEVCEEILLKASRKSPEELKTAHREDFQNLFNRMELHFDGSKDRDSLPTDVRLAAVREGKVDPGLIALYCQYGRYLLISGSRPGSLPLNLQGIWCEDYIPFCNSSYTLNINAQMNYWGAESQNLSECHLPLMDLLEKVKENGEKTAREMYGCRGFMAHHVTDLYGDTAPQDKWMASSYWPMGGAWLAAHIWEHYEYTKDRRFLEEHYDTLYQAVLFFRDFLIKDPEGHLVTCPSLSPENTYITENGKSGRLTFGPAMDCQILTVLFKDYIEASRILDKDEDFRKETEGMLEKLPQPQIGSHGQIVEWIRDYREAEPGHRHVSQLYGLYPGNLFTWEETPDLMKAAQTTLKRRLENGGGHTGWSRAWLILLWDRLREKEKVLENIQALLSGSTFDNMMDSHPLYGAGAQVVGSVFQIDGNLGASAAVTEMLLQSYGNHLVLLPALPEELSSGSLRGLKIRGGGEVQMTWKDGKVTYLRIHAAEELNKTLEINGEIREIHLNPGEEMEIGK